MCEINEEHVLDELAEIAFATPGEEGGLPVKVADKLRALRCCTSIWVWATAQRMRGWSLWMSKERRKKREGARG